jgi:hypothetical protein
MSVILDALRKLDREKSSRRSGTAHIAVEILRPDLPHPGKRIPLYFAVVFLTAIAAAATTYAVMVEFGFLRKSSPPKAVSSPLPNQTAPTSPDAGFLPPSSLPAPIYPPKLNQPVAPTPISPESALEARDKISQAPPKIENPAENKSPEVSRGGKETSQHLIVEKEIVAPGNTKKPVERTPDGSVATRPSLKLSAIVWYEETAKRFAMINGTIVTEGSIIEGVKVVEIYPTRVRFSHNGQPFEISMDR